jgi:transposase-like protein
VEAMSRKRTYRTKEFKFKVALEAVKGQKQIAELAEEYKVHPNQISTWKKELLEKGSSIFDKKDLGQEKKAEAEKDFLYKKVGEQAIQIEWLKKNLGMTQ